MLSKLYSRYSICLICLTLLRLVLSFIYVTNFPYENSMVAKYNIDLFLWSGSSKTFLARNLEKKKMFFKNFTCKKTKLHSLKEKSSILCIFINLQLWGVLHGFRIFSLSFTSCWTREVWCKTRKIACYCMIG